MNARILCRPFVGREDELAFLKVQRLAINAGRGSIVFVAGEAGVGKSRFLAEFCRPLAKSRVRVAVGQCEEFAQRPYGPILDVLDCLDPDALRVSPPESKRDHFDALYERFAKITRRAAVIAIFEDLHWADAATLEFLAHLSGKIDSLRLLAIASYRPEDVRAGHDGVSRFAQIARARRFEQIALKPLNGLQLRRFIDEALTGIDLAGTTRRGVARMGEGNPFFTEELLRSAVERNAHTGNPYDSRRLSTSIRTTVLERLRPLSESARAVLGHAAVIGRRFDVEMLAQTLPIDRTALLATLQHARELQLIDEETDGYFRFRHALTREAIYDQYLQAQARPLHRTIAQAGGSLEFVAYHWWAAGDRENGVHFNQLAGDAAGAVFAHDDAIAAYERALHLEEGRSRISAALQAKIGNHRASLGAHRTASALLGAAADIFREIGDIDAEVAHRIAASQSAHHANMPDPCAPLETTLANLPAEAQRARSLLRLQLAWHEAGLRFRLDVAKRHVAAVDPATIASDPDLTRTYHSVSALIHCLSGDVAALRTESQHARNGNGKLPATDRTAWFEINTAMEFACLDLRDEAREHFAHAQRLAIARNSRNLEAHIYAMSASVLYIDGDLAGVRRAIEAAMALRIDSAIIAGHCAAWGTLAGLALGDRELLTTWFDDADAATHRTEIEYVAAGYADLLTRRGRPSEARALLHDAIAGGDIRRGIVNTLIAVARFGDESDFGRARRLLVAAGNATVDVLERPGLALFEAYVAQRAGRHDAAAVCAREAAAGFRRHRAPLLEAAALEIAGDPVAAAAIYDRIGAAGFAPKSSRPPETREQWQAPKQPVLITKREQAVATLAARGNTNLEIAQHLAISPKTVEKHVSAIYRKLGFSTRSNLTAWVLRSDLADQG